MAVPTHAITSVQTQPSRQRMTVNYLLIWFDGDIDEANSDYKHAVEQLGYVFNQIRICKESSHCIKCLNDMKDEKVFVISSGVLGQDLVPQIHFMKQVRAIYIFCSDKERHEHWTKQWSKIQHVFIDIKSICESLRKITRQYDHNAIPMSFVSKQITSLASASDQLNLDKLEPTFMYSVLFKEIILEIDNNDETKLIKDLVAYCRLQKVSEFQLNEFQDEYYKQSPVWSYTRSTFLYSMLNRALREFNTEAMVKMGFFIRNLHRQLEKLQKDQLNTLKNEFMLYRGQGLTQQDFQHLLEIKNGLLSFNSFLSSSKDQEIAMTFAESTIQLDSEIIGVIFMIRINLSRVSSSTSPFAFINACSAFPQEDEILFSMHTVFRVGDIQQLVTNSRLWEVQLTLTDDNDPQLASLMKHIEKEIDGTGWYRMGQLMFEAGDFYQAEIVYTELLNNTTSDNGRVDIHRRLGEVQCRQGQYKEATASYENCLEFQRKILNENDPSLASTYNAIGHVYKNIGGHAKALEFFEKSLRIRKNALPPNHPDLAQSYNNIARVLRSIADYSKSLEVLEKAQRINEIARPPNHPHLALSFHNIGLVYGSMGDYSKALVFYEKSHKILEIALPPNHPNVAGSYACIGEMHSSMGDYSKAFEFYERAHKIREKVFPPNHPDLATSYNNIGLANHDIGNYTEALEALEKTFQIQQKAFEEINPFFTRTFLWLGRVYRSMKDYTKALSYFEESLTISQKTLPEKHPIVAIAYTNTGDVHRLMGNYEKALSFHRKALNIQENIQCSPLECASTYVNLGETYREMKDYTIALTYFQKGLDICEKKLPKNHPDLAVVYHNLSKLYLSTQEYSLAIKNVQQAIDIAQIKLPSTHPHLIDYRETIEEIQKKM